MKGWRRVSNRDRLERDIDAELRFHVEQQVRELMLAGMTEPEARRKARMEFGGIDQIKEECRDARRFPLIDDLRQDLRYALRMIFNKPGFTLVAVLTLGLGIGANTAVFSIINAVLLRPVNAPDADRLVRFVTLYVGGSTPTQGVNDFRLLQQETTLYEKIAAHRMELANLTGAGDPEQVAAALVSADFLDLFGAPVLEGRTFTAEEDQPNAGHFAILSYEFWAGHFGKNVPLSGQVISINGKPHTVVGVLAPGFDTEQFPQRPDVWIPFQIDPYAAKDGGDLCVITGRLKATSTLQSANAELERISKENNKNNGLTSKVQRLQDAMVGDIRTALIVLMGAVVLVLLIACTNVANLLLVRAVNRSHEISIRAAIGAGRGRIVRQLLTESVLFSLAGGLLGFGLTAIAIRFVIAMSPQLATFTTEHAIGIPRLGTEGLSVLLDWHVLGFTVGLSLITGLTFGLLPALHGARADLSSGLKAGGPILGTGTSRQVVRSFLVTAQISLAIILLIGSGLLIRTFMALHSVKTGFNSDNVLTLRTALNGSEFETRTGLAQLIRQGTERIRSLPGVVAASAACCLPLDLVWQNFFIVQRRPLTGRFHGIAGWNFVSPGYFDTFKIPILRGRAFTERDDATAPGVVIINETLARTMWRNGDPLNDRLLIGRGMSPAYEDDPPRQIIGIVGDVRDVALDHNPRPAMYVPMAQVPDRVGASVLRSLPIAWIVRTQGEPYALRSAIENELRFVGRDVPAGRIRPMNEVIADSIARPQFYMALMTMFGTVALLLAATGIYAVMAYSVEQQTKEVGIRVALGAGAKDIQRMVIFQGMRMTAAGIIAGVVAAYGLTRLLTSFLFGVQPHDPPIFIVIPILLSAVTLFAVWFPAKRVSAIDPMRALRHD